MNNRWSLAGVDERATLLTRGGGRGRPATIVRPILTVRDVCRLLRRSRRQIYRYLKGGRLQPCARILGQWLFSPEEIRLFQSKRLPNSLKPFFWDIRLADLSPEHHRDFILARLLESGDRKAIRWVLRAYPKETLLAFLKGSSGAVLPERTRRFWATTLGERVFPKTGTSRRRGGRRWGGIQ